MTLKFTISISIKKSYCTHFIDFPIKYSMHTLGINILSYSSIGHFFIANSFYSSSLA
jgi:hypothetical protein